MGDLRETPRSVTVGGLPPIDGSGEPRDERPQDVGEPFGNCIRLTASEQDNIRTMLTEASIGYGEDAIKTFKSLLGAEAKSKLDAILGDPQKAPFRKNLYGVFTKGTAADVMSRIYAAINLLQREGVEIPGAVTNFFQSFSRLNDIYQTMTDEMARIDGLIDTLVLDGAKVPPRRRRRAGSREEPDGVRRQHLVESRQGVRLREVRRRRQQIHHLRRKRAQGRERPDLRRRGRRTCLPDLTA